MIRLEAVTAENWKAVTELELFDHQKTFLPSNLYSIAEAQFYKDAQSKAIYVDSLGEKTLVGYALYGIDVATLECKLFRFMIAKEHQRKGYAKLALVRIIENLRKFHGAKCIFLSYQVDNEGAKAFYKQFGFVEKGMNAFGRIDAVLEL